MKLSKIHKLFLITGTIIGTLSLLSSMMYTFGNQTWWVSTESSPLRQFGIGFFHLAGMIIGVVSTSFWFTLGYSNETRREMMRKLI